MLLCRREISRRVQDAAADGGNSDHSAERSALSALLPGSSGEPQLPQKSHLCLVGHLHGIRFCMPGLFVMRPLVVTQKVESIYHHYPLDCILNAAPLRIVPNNFQINQHDLDTSTLSV